MGKGIDAMASDQASSSLSKPERRPVPRDGVGVDVSGKKHAADSGDEGCDEASSDACDGEDEEEEEEGLEGCARSDDDDDGAHREAVLERARKRFERAPRLDEVIYGNTSANLDITDSIPEDKSGPTDHTTLALFDEDEDDAEDGGRAGKSQSVKGSTGSKLLGN